jgi:hypothetical protein
MNKRIKSLSENYMFWIGFQTALLIEIVGGFIIGEHDWKYTMSWGAISILLIGLNKFMFYNKEEEQ